MEEDVRRQDPKTLIDKIKYYKNQIHIMDNRVHRYLSDRKKHKNPAPEKLVDEIRRFENRIYSLLDKDLQFWLENLMNSVIVHEQSWRRLFEMDAEKFRQEQEKEKEKELNRPD